MLQCGNMPELYCALCKHVAGGARNMKPCNSPNRMRKHKQTPFCESSTRIPSDHSKLVYCLLRDARSAIQRWQPFICQLRLQKPKIHQAWAVHFYGDQQSRQTRAPYMFLTIRTPFGKVRTERVGAGPGRVGHDMNMRVGHVQVGPAQVSLRVLAGLGEVWDWRPGS